MPTMAEAARASENRTSTHDTVEVRSLCLLSCQHRTEQLAQYLCASEQEKAARFHFRADYDRYVAARAFLRLQLGAFLDCDPESLLFQYTSHGKPYIENCGIEFNISHSGNWVLFAFSRSAEVGVDIEQMRPLPDMREVAKHHFAASEFNQWEATAELKRLEAFYQCWTRKESFIKAIGEGLSCPLDSFEVTFGSEEPARLTRVDGDEALAAQWWMADLRGFAGYAAAVTTRRDANLGDVRLAVTDVDGAGLLK
ncbi:MAG TPA: 4'-phosphopantetheinyl transferase superfamily protein [Candidatus Angelobacter sp.]|nr:4'-phosphopantetheinyl transferase superfamily protein [Candidatus Angelobacter sp.]